MKIPPCALLFIAILTVPFSPALGAVQKVYESHRAASTPVIDGDLSDDCWRNAAWLLIGKKASTPARASLSWDEVYLYFAATIKDDTPRREYSARDAEIWSNDCFEIYLQPETGSIHYYELDFNSSGAIWDSFNFLGDTKRKRLLKNWNASSLVVSTQVVDGGWTLEGRIRFDEFAGAKHLAPQHDDRWRANFFYLDSPTQGGAQKSFSWNPTENFDDVAAFGTLRFVDWNGHADDMRTHELARFFMEGNRLAGASAVSTPDAPIAPSSSAGKYVREATGWRPATGFGRVAFMKPKNGEPISWRVQPNAGDDPTRVEWQSERDGVLVVLGRLLPAMAALVEDGEADGVRLSTQSSGASSTLHLRDEDWRATTIKIKKGETIRVTLDAGEAQNLSGDSAQIALLEADETVLDPQLPDNWQAFGGDGLTVMDAKNSQAMRVTASGAFTGARREVPAPPGAKIYKISGQVRTELFGTTWAHVGVDFLDKDGHFIRQATTRDGLKDFLRWGVANWSGMKDWTRFVAYAYDAPPEAATLSMWAGINAWEAPDAKGQAWFSDLRIEAVPYNKNFPLGFSPVVWKPVASTPPIKGDYLVTRTPITKYQLPSMPQSVTQDDKELDLLAWPGDAAPVSFSIFAARELGEVRVEVSDLVSRNAKISASQIELRRVRYLFRKRDMMRSDEYWVSPNHLEKFATLKIVPGQSQQCWLTVAVPSDGAPGRYEGTLRVIPSRGKAKALRLTLNILPISPQVKRGVLIGFYSYYMKNDTPQTLREMFADMKAHGMTTTFHFNNSLHIPIVQNAEGKVLIVWDETNRLRDLFDAYRDAGFNEPLLLLAPDDFYEAAKKYGDEKMGAAFTRVLADLWQQVRDEAKRCNWKEFIVAPYDEGYPYPMSDLRFALTRAGIPAQHAVGVPVALHSLNHPTRGGFEFESEFESSTDVILQTFCHPPGLAGPRFRGYENWEQYRDAMHADGRRVLFYNPDVTGVHPEAMRFAYGVALWKTQADGMMNWHYYEEMKDGGYDLSARQGHSVKNFNFPAMGEYSGGPTIGWEAAREGVKDYQLLCTLDALIQKWKLSHDAAQRSRAMQAESDIQSFLDRVHLDTIETTGALSLGDWETEPVNEHNEREVRGQYQINNGFSLEDYDRLRQMLCTYIVEFQAKK